MITRNRVRRGLTLLALSTIAGTLVPSAPAAARPGDPYASLPQQLVLSGTVRDVKARNQDGGHTDFEWVPTGGYGLYANMVLDALDQDGKPVFRSKGYKVSAQPKDSSNRPIIFPRSYINPMPGDLAGSKSSSTGGSFAGTAETFAQWFRDVPGVNVSMSLPLTFVRQENTNRFVFDDRLDPDFSSLGGFFPINGQLYGNYSSTGKNFHFTFELDTEFVYQQGAGHIFTFTGDDDVWVFVDGKLVIDLGGVHSAQSQTIALDRLNWLQNGQTYSLRFFFSERHTTQSNFRIETTIECANAQLPSTTALAD